jgi:hypothetical protein
LRTAGFISASLATRRQPTLMQGYHDHPLAPGACCPCLSHCRFILNYLGNKTAALTPDVPRHVFAPVQLNCPAPAAKLGTAARLGKITADSFAVGTSRQGMFGGCPLTLYLQYQQVTTVRAFCTSLW